ncbi:hypothetical protein D0024_24725 [Salmonella enterica]|nr:hypothetical protein [Salmonella enterica]
MNRKQLEQMLERESRITMGGMLSWFERNAKHPLYDNEEAEKVKQIHAWLCTASDAEKEKALQWYKDWYQDEAATGEQKEMPEFNLIADF